MPALELEWFGCTTYRLRVGALVLMFDAYLDKAPGAEPAGLRADVIDRCDYVFVSHAHFDHMVDAADIARRTGATVVASYETVRVLRAEGIRDEQLLPVSGGETIVCADDVRVRVLPGLHSCLFAASTSDSGSSCLGDLHVGHQQRRRTTAELFALLPHATPGAVDYFTRVADRCSSDDGGQLVFHLDSPGGSVLVSASSGYWTGLSRDLRPDLAILALNGRPNVDGEPFQGSLADYLLGYVHLLRPRQVTLCHHDALLPPVAPAVDATEALRRLTDEAPDVCYVDLPLLTPTTLALRP